MVISPFCNNSLSFYLLFLASRLRVKNSHQTGHKKFTYHHRQRLVEHVVPRVKMMDIG